MKPYKDLTKAELLALKESLNEDYKDAQKRAEA